jgi:hypothetical protein
MDRGVVRAELMEIARKRFSEGMAYSMETVVLRDFRERHPEVEGKLKEEQVVIECWQDLFLKGVLVPGWDLENPSLPWFHVPKRDLLVETTLNLNS